MMNEEIEEVEAILKPTRMKRRVVLFILVFSLILLVSLGILLNCQIDYLQINNLNHIKWIPTLAKSVVLFRVLAIVCASMGLYLNKLPYWNLTSSCIFLSYFISGAVNVFVIVVCPDLSKRVWSVLIILAELFLNIISTICSMIETYQTIITINSSVSLELVDPQKELIMGLLKAIFNVLPGVSIFSDQLVKAVKMD